MVSMRNEEHGTVAPAAEHDHRCACGSAEHPSPDQPPESLPDEELLYDLADLFKVFGDTTRIKILYALMGTERCVADIAELIGATQCARSSRPASSSSSATARTSSTRCPTTTCTPCSPRA